MTVNTLSLQYSILRRTLFGNIPVEERDDLSARTGGLWFKGCCACAVGDGAADCPKHSVVIILLGPDISKGIASDYTGLPLVAPQEGRDLSSRAAIAWGESRFACTGCDTVFDCP